MTELAPIKNERHTENITLIILYFARMNSWRVCYQHYQCIPVQVTCRSLMVRMDSIYLRHHIRDNVFIYSVCELLY